MAIPGIDDRIRGLTIQQNKNKKYIWPFQGSVRTWDPRVISTML